MWNFQISKFPNFQIDLNFSFEDRHSAAGFAVHDAAGNWKKKSGYFDVGIYGDG